MTDKVFIIEFYNGLSYDQSLDFPNYYTGAEATAILIDRWDYTYRMREVEIDFSLLRRTND
jgi:hypothetical protein